MYIYKYILTSRMLYDPMRYWMLYYHSKPLFLNDPYDDVIIFSN